MEHTNNVVWYDDVTVDKVFINKNGGISILPIKQGVSGRDQYKYDNNPRYGGSNGTYVDRRYAGYIPVEYEIIVQVVIRWNYKGDTYEKRLRFNATNAIEKPYRMTENAKKKIENQLRNNNYRVSHEKDTGEWRLHSDAWIL